MEGGALPQYSCVALPSACSRLCSASPGMQGHYTVQATSVTSARSHPKLFAWRGGEGQTGRKRKLSGPAAHR